MLMEYDDELPGELPDGAPITAVDLTHLKVAEPTMWFDETNGCISIPVPTARDPVTVYSVDLVRLMNPLSLLAWTAHLAGKPWMDRKRLREFIRLVAKTQNFKLPHSL